ncbi:uncharacterized protein LOC143025231 [Oratosquilla oratoria]|uniref:uncharacterized protein LOC143025231 n=1 Tax=Oratosquilla oratoria TaxID=337810 RepID=UPI003F7749C4
MTIDLLKDPSILVVPLKPEVYLTSQLSLPQGSKELGGAYELAMAIAIVLRLSIDVYEVIHPSRRRGGRSIQEDQFELFKQIEDNFSGMGINGRSCVLKFICELQQQPFSSSSIFGEIFTIMFTPKKGDDYTLLNAYLEAEARGQQEGFDCSSEYWRCPFSVFETLKRIRDFSKSSSLNSKYSNGILKEKSPKRNLYDEVNMIQPQ